MGSDISREVGEYVDYEGFPSALSKSILKEYRKRVKGMEKKEAEAELEALQSGDEADKGRNQERILSHLSDDLRLQAYGFIYGEMVKDCLLFRDLFEGDSASFDRFARILSSKVTRVYAEAKIDVPLAAGFYFVKRGFVEITTDSFHSKIHSGSIFDVSLVVTASISVCSCTRRLYNYCGRMLALEESAVFALPGCEYGFVSLADFDTAMALFLRAQGRLGEKRLFEMQKAEREEEERKLAAEEAAQRALNDELCHLVEHGDLERVKGALDRGAQVNAAVGPHATTAVLAAAARGEPTILEMLLLKGGDIAAVNHYGWGALHIACKYGRVAIIETLLDKGCDPNLKTRREGNNAVHFLAEKGSLSIIKDFVALCKDRGIALDVTAKNMAGMSPMDCCPTLEHKRALKPRTMLALAMGR
eukprot:PLAT4605.2.p1 GENE.PLAT4605.2~~PLAT4605.2.p1  ORF type:complete len:418 (+),score=197.60 PLAT4605.2:75-1328(+)